MSDIIEQMQADVASIKNGTAPEAVVQEPVRDAVEQDVDQGSVDVPTQVNHVEDDAPQYSAQEKQAMADGWRPQEDWKGDADDWVGAKEFNRAKSLFNKIGHEVKARKAQEAKLAELEASFQERINNVIEVTRQQTLADLNKQKREAVESADYDQVQEIDEQIAVANEKLSDVPAKEAVPAAADQTEIRGPVQNWVESNSWFESDNEMTDFAISYQQSAIRSNAADPSNPSDAELQAALDRTSQAVKRAYPDKFTSTNKRPQVSSVEAPAPRTRTKKFTTNDLSSEEKAVMGQMDFYGAMDNDAYVQAVADMKTASERVNTKPAPYKNRKIRSAK